MLLAHISGGYYHSAAVTKSGQVYTWGWGDHGQLGHGMFRSELSPRKVTALAGVHMIALECGGFHSAGYDSRGRCWTFGLGEHGQLGILEDQVRPAKGGNNDNSADSLPESAPEAVPPTKRSLPTVVESLRGKSVVFVAASLWHTMAIVALGENLDSRASASRCRLVSEGVQLLESHLLPQASAGMSSASFGCLPLYQGEEEAEGDEHQVESGDDAESDDYDHDYENGEDKEAGEENKPKEPLKQIPLEVEKAHPASKQALLAPSPDQGLIGRLATWILQTERKEKLLDQRVQFWESQVLMDWQQMRTNPKVRKLWKKGIPPAVRGKVWPLAIPNFLVITPAHYASLKEASYTARAQRVQSMSAAGLKLQPGAIELDLPRTFPKLSVFNEDGPFHRQLWDILETYAIFRPEIGYVQGMSFLAAMFLLYMDEFTSFRCLANMLEFPFLRALYKMDIGHILRFVKIYELLFSRELPDLYTEFIRNGVSSEHYLLDWFFTLFSRALPFDIVGRLWDRYLLDGEAFLFRTALAILKIFYPRLRGNSFEEICMLLRQLPQDMDETVLFHAIGTIKVPSYCKRFIQRLYTEDKREIQMESVAGGAPTP